MCFERGALTSCFAATPDFRIIRLHTRYRRDLIAGQRNPKMLAQLARTRARRKITRLEQVVAR